MSKISVPYHDLDPNIRQLVRVLNSLPGITTLGSCGGHANPSPIQHDEDEWFVTFRISLKAGGWRSLEYITGALGWADRRAFVDVNTGAPGYTTGRALFFSINGFDFIEADHVAAVIKRIASEDGVSFDD